MVYTQEDPPLFQVFYRVKLGRSSVGWHSVSVAVPALEYAVRHALLDAERHRLHSMQAELEAEYCGATLTGYPVGLVQYVIVRLKRTPFWCCRDPKEMGTVVERFDVDISKHKEQPPYELAIPAEDE